MNIVIIEDEAPAARRLQNLLAEIDPASRVIARLESVEESISWIKTNEEPDLYIMDIQLSDGLSFDIFEQCDIKKPVIFATAFDEYAIQAFKVHSIDYLLKPIDKKELKQALDKYTQWKGTFQAIQMEKLLLSVKPAEYRTRFLVKRGQRLTPLTTEQVAYFYAEDKCVFLITKDEQSYIVDDTLDQLEIQLDPRRFFRANRKFLVSHAAIYEIRTSLNSKLKLVLQPECTKEDIYVSREKATLFKQWLN